MIAQEIFDNISDIEKSQIEKLEDALKVYFEQNKILKSKLSDFQNLRNEVDGLKAENERLKSELAHTKNELSAKAMEFNHLSRNSADLELIRNKFAEIDILPLYEKLSDRIKESLSNVFVRSDSVSLLSAGIQKSNLLALYDALFNRIKQDSLENYDEMLQIVRRLFEIYNLGQKEPYILIEPESRTPFNEDEHLIKGSDLGGTISKVWLFGYKTVKGTVQKKAFVEVR
ncbi:MAG: hypothetical protein IKP73_07555 [Bacteroidales bacterium]|nr:hypothetical protein [Bacteroidales bacterium]